jgi:hypothetical protein
VALGIAAWFGLVLVGSGVFLLAAAAGVLRSATSRPLSGLMLLVAGCAAIYGIFLIARLRAETSFP